MSLVSIIISTFNSSQFIIETLESLSKQTWEAIELIITDDYSSDNTVAICQKWLDENRLRFHNVEVITSKVNSGVSANANRGLNASTGKWVKFLGADDTLKVDCIEHNMNWVTLHPEIQVLFSRVDIYNSVFAPENLVGTTEDDSAYPNSIMAPGRSAASQYKMLLVSDRIHYTPSVFISRDAIISVGGFDERFKLMEDYPLWLNLTRSGYTLHFMNKVTINYRMHSKAINNTGLPHLVNPNYFKTECFRRLYTYKYIPYPIRLNQRYTWYASQVFRLSWFNRERQVTKIILNILTVYINPFTYLIWIKKSMNRSLKDNEFYI